MTDDDETRRLLERLVSDPAFRARFDLDPAGTAREAGLDRLALELASDDGRALQPLEHRESRSSLAGALTAAAAEGIALFELGGHLFGADAAEAATGHAAGAGVGVGAHWSPDQFGAQGSGGPVTPETSAVLHDANVVLDTADRTDLQSGRIDPRVVSVLTDLSHQHKLVISSMLSDHTKLTTNGSVSNHYYGRAFDIASIDGHRVDASNGEAKAIAIALSQLPASIRPSEIGSPWALPGAAYFTDADHQNHLHIGFDAPITPNWQPPPADAAAPVVPGQPAEAAQPADAAQPTAAPAQQPVAPAQQPVAAAQPVGSEQPAVPAPQQQDAVAAVASGNTSDDDDDDDSEDDDGSDDDTDAPGEGSNGEDANDDDSSDDSGDDSGDNDPPNPPNPSTPPSDAYVDNPSNPPNPSTPPSDAYGNNPSNPPNPSTPDSMSPPAPSAGTTTTAIPTPAAPAEQPAQPAAPAPPAATHDPPDPHVASATPDVPVAPTAYPGDHAQPAQIAEWMAAAAKQRGLPPELPVMASLVEAGLKNDQYGDADSVGFFQMRESIWNNGAYAGYASRPQLQLQWFLDHAEGVKAQREAAGLSVTDPKQYGEWIADIERPAAQYRGRYQLRLDEARGLLAQPAPTPSTRAAPSANQAQVFPAFRQSSTP